MKKSELRQSWEYALGSTSRYDRFSAAHVRIVEVDGERTRSNGTVRRGIVVQFVENSNTFGFRGKAGEEAVLDSARGFRSLWSEYVKAKRLNDEAEAKTRAERDRRNALAEEAVLRLRALGFDADRGWRSNGIHWSGNKFELGPDEMKHLLDRIPT